jgi:hypothetical protein
MKRFFAVIPLLFCINSQATELDNSLGFGFQYGGILGWQGSVTENNLHARFALGLVGASVGADVDINKYTSVGVTVSRVTIADVKALSLNYYISGKYTEGWRVGLDVGSATNGDIESNEGDFVAVSFGYSFK